MTCTNSPARSIGASSSRWLRRICFAALFFLAAAASFHGFYEKWHFREAGTGAWMPGASLEEMLEGSAARPFVMRRLLPALANGIDEAVPEGAKDRLFNVRLYSGKLFRDGFIDSPMARDRGWFLRYWVIHTAVFFFAWIAVAAMYFAARAAGDLRAAAALAAVAIILAFPYFTTRGGFFYDYPEMAFFALAVWIALRFDWVWLIPLVALASLNKESFLFFIPALYPLMRSRCARSRAIAGAVVLVVTSAAVDGALWLRYRHNPGGATEWHLADQIAYMLHPLNMLAREKTYGLQMFQTFNPLFLALVACIAVGGWRHLPRPIQRHAQIAAIINLPLYLLFCLPGELRDLSMVYPSLLFLLAANFNLWTRDDIASETTAANSC